MCGSEKSHCFRVIFDKFRILHAKSQHGQPESSSGSEKENFIAKYFDPSCRSLVLSVSWPILLKLLEFLHNFTAFLHVHHNLQQQYYADTTCTLTLTAMTSTKTHTYCVILKKVTSSCFARLQCTLETDRICVL